LVYLLHTLITELITDRTIGKMIFGLRVVGLDGNRPSRGAIIVRQCPAHRRSLAGVSAAGHLHFAITPSALVI